MKPKLDQQGNPVFKDGKQVMIADDGSEVLVDQKDDSAKKEDSPKDAYMSKAEVDALLAKVRKEEKDKLYPQIDSHKNKIDTLEQLVNSLKAQIDAQSKDGDKNTKKVVDENVALLEKIEALQAQMNDTNVRLEQERKDRENERTKLQLDTYRERKLREAGEDIIPELVTGATEAEIDESIAHSRSRFKEIFKAEKTKRDQDKQNQIDQTPGAPPSNPPAEEVSDILTDADREAVRNARTPAELDEIKKKLGIPLAHNSSRR